MMLIAEYRRLREFWKSEVNPQERERIASLGAISFAEQRIMHEKLTSGNPLAELDYPLLDTDSVDLKDKL